MQSTNNATLVPLAGFQVPVQFICFLYTTITTCKAHCGGVIEATDASTSTLAKEGQTGLIDLRRLTKEIVKPVINWDVPQVSYKSIESKHAVHK